MLLVEEKHKAKSISFVVEKKQFSPKSSTIAKKEKELQIKKKLEEQSAA